MRHTMDKQIENCPFCGGEAFLVVSVKITQASRYSVRCRDCLVETPSCTVKDAIMNQWNQRTTPTLPAGQAEAVARAFHNAYEDAALRYGWKTQESCRVGFDDLPEANRLTMLDATAVVLKASGAEVKSSFNDSIDAINPEHIAGWQPIESAPKDGTYIDIWIPHNICERYTDAYYSESANAWCWNVEGAGQRVVFTETPPTHWMPLPLPPEMRVASQGTGDQLNLVKQV